MVSHEVMVKELNEDFERYLGEMKPFVLQLQLKSERQRSALWIKKLCEPHIHSGLEGRKIRNSYCKALLNMLKKGVMEGPLLHRPPDGKLDQFPDYLDEYLRDPEPEVPQTLPDWLVGLDDNQPLYEIDNRETVIAGGKSGGHDSGRISMHVARERVEEILATQKFEEQLDSAVHLNGKNSRSPGERNRKRTSRTVSFPVPRYVSPLDEITSRRTASYRFSSDEESDNPAEFSTKYRQHVSEDKKRDRSPDAPHRSPERSRTRSPERQRLSRSPVFIREHQRLIERNFDKEVEMKVKVIENKLYEEKLLMQQKNDEEIQKILDRKNSEIEEIKCLYKKKLDCSEEEICKLEKKVQTVLKDAQIVRESKDAQITELKKMAEESSTTKINSLEKKFHDLQTEHEQEKIEIQKAHTASIQQLMDETSSRLQKMEDDYRKQSKAMADTIRELEKRIQALTIDAEKLGNSKQVLEQCKIELETKVEQLAYDYNEYKVKYDHLEREHKKIIEDHRHSVDLLKEKHESQMSFAKKDHQLTINKNSDTIMSLEQQLSLHKQTIQDLENQRQRQVRELEQSYKQDRIHSDNLSEKKVKNLQRELEQLESDYKKKIQKLEKALSDRDQDVKQLQEKLLLQASQAEVSLQEIRVQVEKQQDQVNSDLKQQMQQVVAELENSKLARRQQTDEFEAKIKQIAESHVEEVKSLKEAWSDEKRQLAITSQQQVDYLQANHQKEIELLKKNSKAEKEQSDKNMKLRKSEYEAKINELSEQIHDLKDELAQGENLSKQQLMELGLLKEEETQRLNNENERALERLRTEFEREKHALHKQHASEIENNIEKTNLKLKNIERDYSERLSKQAEQTADLQIQLEQLKAEKHRLTDQLESQIVDNHNKYEEDKKSLRKQSASTILGLKQEIEALKSKIRQMERECENMAADHEEDMIQLRLEYEEKIRGLIPADAREQLEATVSSLKNQVNTLKQRIAILQDS